MGFGGQPQQQSQTTTYELSPEQRQLMNLAMPGVTQFAASTPQRYQGTTIAGFDPSQTAGQEAALTASQGQTALGQQGAATTTNWLSPNATDISQNPQVQSAISTATRPVWEQLERVGLPGIRDAAERSGNFGASRQGIAEGLATGEATKAAGDISSKIASDAYKTNVDAQLKALGLLPSTVGTLPAGALTESNVGDVRQAMEQAKLGETVGNFNWDQLAPLLQSKEIMSIMAGLPGGSTQTVATAPQRNPLTSSLGGAASGAALGSMFGPIGTAAGAGIGGLLPFISA